MTGADRTHFDTYRTQTRLKHEILAAYLPAFFHVLKPRQQNLVYIDAFAGRGTYSDPSTEVEVPGSPLLALDLIANDETLATRVSTLFIEVDQQNFAELEQAIQEFCQRNTSVRIPVLMNATFSEAMDHVLSEVSSLAPTFLFVDPCGMRGASFATMKRVMEADRRETFMFFNLEAVRRVAGLANVNESLIELYGSRKRAEELIHGMRRIRDVQGREDFIIAEYRRACIEEMDAKFVVAFRVEREDRRTTSHFFIHVTKHHRGFAIMKDVMWSRGRTNEGSGGLEFVQSSHTPIEPMMRIGWEEFKNTVEASIADSVLKISVIYEDWVCRPDNLYCRAAYRQSLIELESEERIEVLGKDGSTPAPARSRRRWRGQITMPETHFVRRKLH